MELGDLFDRSVTALWRHKFLIGIGILLALISGEGIAERARVAALRLIPLEPLARAVPEAALLLDRIPQGSPEPLLRLLRWLGPRGLLIALAAGFLGLIILGVIILALHGALVAGVGETDETGEASFKSALRTGWARTWRLLIAASYPAIPVTVAAILLVIGAGEFITRTGGIETLGETLAVPSVLPGVIGVVLLILFPFGLASAFLLFLWPLAERACVLENLPASAAFKRAWQVLRDSAGPVLLVYLVQWGVGIALSSVLFIPRLLVSFWLVFIPLLWIIAGAGMALRSALWTVAWRGWTAGDPEPVGENGQ